MTSWGWPCHWPRVPSGMAGEIDCFAAAFCSVMTLRSRASITAPQLVQATSRVWARARSSTAAPQLTQLKPCIAFDLSAASNVRTFCRCNSSNETKRPTNSTGVSSL